MVLPCVNFGHGIQNVGAGRCMKMSARVDVQKCRRGCKRMCSSLRPMPSLRSGGRKILRAEFSLFAGMIHAGAFFAEWGRWTLMVDTTSAGTGRIRDGHSALPAVGPDTQECAKMYERQ
jgi:hypothetical protein